MADQGRRNGKPVFRGQVVRTERLTPHMIRVVCGGEGLASFQHNGFTAVVTAHVDDIKRGRLDFPEFVRKHNPRVFIYDVSIPYVENWRALELLMKTDVMRSRRVVVTTTNKRALDQLLGGRVEPRRGLVEDHQAGVLQEDPGEGQQLRLARRQPTAPVAKLGVQSLGQGAVPAPQAQVAEHLQDALVGDRGVEQRQVVAHRGPEELHVLGDHADMLAQVVQGGVA